MLSHVQHFVSFSDSVCGAVISVFGSMYGSVDARPGAFLLSKFMSWFTSYLWLRLPFLWYHWLVLGITLLYSYAGWYHFAPVEYDAEGTPQPQSAS